jgi:hypothetical protein
MPRILIKQDILPSEASPAAIPVMFPLLHDS